MSGILEWLDGKKTVICMFLLAVNTFVFAMGWISQTVFTTIEGFLLAAGGMALRAAISKGPTQ